MNDQQQIPVQGERTFEHLLETVKISLVYRDFGVLNEYLSIIGENKIPAPTKNSALVESKPDELDESLEDERILEDARVSALILTWFDKWCKDTKRGGGVLVTTSIKEVLTDFYHHIKSTQPLSGTTPSSGANSSFNSGNEK